MSQASGNLAINTKQTQTATASEIKFKE